MKRTSFALLIGFTSFISFSNTSHAIFNSVCEPDSQRYCLGLINEGTDALLKCLRENEKNLMPPCRAKVIPQKDDKNKS
jgi:hypothetical protein